MNLKIGIKTHLKPFMSFERVSSGYIIHLTKHAAKKPKPYSVLIWIEKRTNGNI